MDNHVNVARGLLPLGNDVRETIAKDAFHASIGAACLTDGVGQDGVTKFVGELISTSSEDFTNKFVVDEYDKTSMSKLNERLDRMGVALPKYVSVEQEGDVKNRFTAKCLVHGEVSGRGEGRTLKEARHRAAAKVLDKGEKWFMNLINNVKRESP